MTVQYEVVKGCMTLLAEGAATGSLGSLGLLPQDVKRVTGGIPWNRDERLIVIRTLDALMFGTMDLLALPRFQVPAEYVAAVVSMFVHPCNLMVASMWMATSGLEAASSLGSPTSQSANCDSIDAATIFAIAAQLNEDGHSRACLQQFENRTTMAVVKSLGVKNNEVSETASSKK